jgi:DNA repair protein RadC
MTDGGKSAKKETAEAALFPDSDEQSPTKHYHGHRERLRQRVLEGDGSHLKDYELLELLLCAFIPRVDVKPIAKDLLAEFGTVSGVLAAPPERLTRVKGIGETAAAHIRASGLLLQRAAGDQIRDRPVISNWAALLNYVSTRIKHEKTEQVRVLYLDKKNKLIADEKAGQGTVDHAPIYPREVARRALELSASSVILVHNRPSGDPTPSRADVDLTREIERALATLEMRVLDHLVVGANETISMKAKGLI